MGTNTDFNVSPYFDDFQEDKNFSRILFRPSVPVQARELTQLQTLLQSQLERFGENIFKEGTIIKGVSFSFDSAFTYVKLLDNRVDGQPLQVLSHDGQWVRGETNDIIASVVSIAAGLQTDGVNLNTFFIKYVNSSGAISSFIESEILSIYPTQIDAENQTNKVAQIAVADQATFGTSVVGKGFAFEVTDGVIFQKGFFVRVPAQQVVVSKYTNIPNDLAVGFDTVETIVDSNADTSLLDNAAGFTNENAPGAHRLKLDPQLITLTFAEKDARNNFFALVEFEAGKVVKSRQLTEFSSLGREFARRTKEESGDYVVEPFRMITEDHATDVNKFNLITSAGIGYVNGYRVENTNNNLTEVNRGITTETVVGQGLSLNYGSFVIVKEMVGVFNHSSGATIDLRDTAGTRLTDRDFSALAAPGASIGTARIIAVERISGVSGTPEARHRIYINDIKMTVGKNFKDVKSLFFATGITAMADLVLESSLAVLKDPSQNGLIFPFAQTAAKDLANSDYIYGHVNEAASFASTGSMTITVPNPDTLTYGPSNTLTDSQKSEITIVSNATGGIETTAKTGTATAADSGPDFVVSGTGTLFLTEFKVGQYIALAANSFRRITAITSNTSLKVDVTWTVGAGAVITRLFPAFTPIPLVDAGVTITTSANSQDLIVNLNTGLAATMAVSVYVDVKATSAASGQIAKTSNKVYVKIDTTTHANGTVGPWSLGLADVWVVNKIHEGVTFGTSEPNNISKFDFITGQKDSHYGLSALSLKPGKTVTGKLLIQVEVFEHGTVGGYFNVESYPVDDSASPAVNTIKTERISLHISDSGQEFDLRDAIDTRPFVTNTSVIATTEGTATINPSDVETIAGTLRLPAPNRLFGMDLTFFLGRIDSVIVDSFGTFSVIEGTPAISPRPSRVPDGAMLIGFSTVPPFPSLTTKAGSAIQRPEYTILTKQVQQKVYTMDDIGSIDQRLANVEYYTALTLLEKSAADLFIPTADGLNRFKHGIFVDNFETVLAADFTHPEFSVSYDQAESSVTAPFEVFDINMVFDSATNMEKKGDLVIGDSTDVVAIQQSHASRVRNTAESFWSWSGAGQILPAYDSAFDTSTNPVSTSTSPAVNAIIAINNPIRISTRRGGADGGGFARSGRSLGTAGSIRMFID